MTVKTFVPGSATATGILLHGLCHYAKAAQEVHVGAPPEIVYLNKIESDAGGRKLIPLATGDWRLHGDVGKMDMMKETLTNAMDRVPPAFWDVVKIPSIYCVEAIRFEYAPELVIDAVFSREDNSIAFRYGYENTIFHELGHAMDNVRVSDDFDPKWEAFGELVCKQVDQDHIRYLSTLNSAWTCKADDEGNYPDWMNISPTNIKEFFGETISTHFDGCYAASAGYEDRQEIFRAMMEEDQRENYLFNDKGPQWGKKGCCKCTHCEREFHPMEEAAALGNRFAVLRAKSWWQYFTINQNDNVINEDTRDKFWELDELYSGPHVLERGMFFLDAVRLRELEASEREQLDQIVQQYGKFHSAYNNVVMLADFDQKNTFREALKQLRIFNITEEDLGEPMQGGKSGMGSTEIMHSPVTSPTCGDEDYLAETQPDHEFCRLSPTALNEAIIKSPPAVQKKVAKQVQIKLSFMEELRQQAAATKLRKAATAPRKATKPRKASTQAVMEELMSKLGARDS